MTNQTQRIRRRGVSTTGFTFLEIAIILTIIAVLAAAIMCGNSMIATSKLMAIGNQINQYKNATKLFLYKYKYLPGDMPNATSFWGTSSTGCALGSGESTSYSPATCNGNGDGAIGSLLYTGYPNAIVNAEWLLFWQHLTNAGFITGAYGCANGYNPADYSLPLCAPYLSTPTGGVAVVSIKTGFYWEGEVYQLVPTKMASQHYFAVGNPVGAATSFAPWGLAFTPNEAQALDAKFDDGLPFSGTITAPYTNDFLSNTQGLCATSTNYVGSDTIAYTQTQWGPTPATGCFLYFDLGF